MTDAATEKFAALLRELKQRSGRSYGALAARLHVSTSTLHRYCNGDAVPASYAPAERLARLCGATPEELIELHRRWHRANGTRRGTTPSWATEEEASEGSSGRESRRRGPATAPRAGAPGGGRAPGAQSPGADVPDGRGAAGPAAASAAPPVRTGGTAGSGGGAGAPAVPRGSADGADTDAPAALGAASAREGRSSGAAAPDERADAVHPPAAVRGAAAGADGSGGGTGGSVDKSSTGPASAGVGRSADRVGAVPPAAAHGSASGEDGSVDKSSAGGPFKPGARRPADGADAVQPPAASHGSVDKSSAGRPSGPGARRPAAGARGPWWGRPRVFVPAAGLAAAVLVAVVATSSGSTGEGRANAGEVPGSGAGVDGSRGGGRDVRGAETLEKGGRGEEPADGRTPSAAGGGAEYGAGNDGEPRRGGSAAEARPRPAVDTPLAWSVRSHVWEFGCDHRYVLNKSPEDVPPPPMEQDAEAWATSQGAVHGGTTNVEAVIEPRGDEPVTINAVHVRKTGAATPLPWTAFAMSDGCGGEITEAEYRVDLDAPRPVLKPENGSDGTQVLEPPKLPYRVTPDDPLSLLVHAATQDHDVRWYLEVEWSRGDDSGVIRIDDQGGPFRTSAIKDRPLYGYDSLNGKWRTWPLVEESPPDPATAVSPAP